MRLDSGKSRKSCLIGCVVVLLLIVGGALAYGPDKIVALFKVGAWAQKEGLLDPEEQRKWEGTSEKNLQALQIALNKYAESEGKYPKAESWMDDIQRYIKTADLTPEEAKKKFVNPLIKPEAAGVYGYALNKAIAGKVPDDIKDPKKTVLVFDSKNTAWNASGDPTKDAAKPERPGGNKAIPVEGSATALNKLTGAP